MSCAVGKENIRVYVRHCIIFKLQRFPSFPQLFDTGGDVLLFYNERTMGTLVKAMAVPGAAVDPASDMSYHINLICLLAMCTEGKNDTTEIKCHCLLPLHDVVCIITHEACIPEVRSQFGCSAVSKLSVSSFLSSFFCTCGILSSPSLLPLSIIQVKTAYVEFLMHCYIDTDVEIKEIYTRNHMWVVFNNFVEDIQKVRRELL